MKKIIFCAFLLRVNKWKSAFTINIDDDESGVNGNQNIHSSTAHWIIFDCSLNFQGMEINF